MDKEDSDLRDVPGYEGRYAVTSNGRVWSYRLARWLKPFLSSRGYQQVNFRREVGRNVMPLVHRLVALAWIPNPAGLLEVNHLNGRKSHNFVANLEWCSRLQNDAHARRTGLTKPSPDFGGRRANTCKLDAEKVALIKVRLARGEHYADMAQEFGVAPITVYFIKAGRSWRDVTPGF